MMQWKQLEPEPYNSSPSLAPMGDRQEAFPYGLMTQIPFLKFTILN